jgi:hypothetical protein
MQADREAIQQALLEQAGSKSALERKAAMQRAEAQAVAARSAALLAAVAEARAKPQSEQSPAMVLALSSRALRDALKV